SLSARAAAARPGSRTPSARSSPDDLPFRLVAVELLDRVGVERMLALGNVDVLRLAAERGGEVPLAGVVDRGDDRAELGMTARELQRRGDVAAAGDPTEDPFLAREAPRDVDALLGRRRDDAGEDRDVEVAWDESVADAFD